MGLDLWFPDDVKRTLAGLAAAGDLHGKEYHKALADVATAFGVPAPKQQPAPTWQVIEPDNGRNTVTIYPERRW